MNKRNILFFLVLIVGAMTASAQYYTQAETPNAVIFYPAPPDFKSTLFSVDTKKYFSGKDVQKDPVRGPQIQSDVQYSVPNLANIFTPYLKYDITSITTPKLWTLMLHTFTTSAYGSTRPKSYYLRKRPCTLFNEKAYSNETNLKTTYSYPSSHTMVGWGVGTVLAAVAPHSQDSILYRAFDYGQSRVYGGMHWQSDVDAARVIASACVARMLTSEMFKTHLATTRQELNTLLADSLGIAPPDYDAENYYDADHLPNPLVYLPQPPALDVASPELAHDMSQYIWGKSVRETDRGIKARFDTNTDVDLLINDLAGAFDCRVSKEYTPAIYELLRWSIELTDEGCKKAQTHYNRQRPYDFFKEKPYTFESPDELSKTGSYPSVGAARAWTAAMMLVAISPAQQDTIFTVGYDLGQSPVIAGINWQSDVDAGRLVSSAVFARMLSNPHFMDLLEQAQAEHTGEKIHIITDQDDLTVDKAPENDNRLYTIDGRIATPDSKGVLVGRGKKIVR